MSAAPPDNGRMEVLLADANVLIDLLNANALGLVGDLIRHDLAAVYLPQEVVERALYENLCLVLLQTAQQLCCRGRLLRLVFVAEKGKSEFLFHLIAIRFQAIPLASPPYVGAKIHIFFINTDILQLFYEKISDKEKE